MAAGAAFDIAAHAFLPVQGDDPGGLVLMTAITGRALEIVAKVAGRAGDIMISVEPEEAVMRKRRGPPAGCAMALTAVRAAQLPVERVGWGHMATGAGCARLRPQQRMVELRQMMAGQSGPGMIGVTGHAFCFNQLLVKHGLAARQRPALGREQTNAISRVTGEAAIGSRAPQGCVAGETILRESGMRRDNGPGRDHQFGRTKLKASTTSNTTDRPRITGRGITANPRISRWKSDERLPI